MVGSGSCVRAAAMLLWVLDDQRDARDVGEVLARHAATRHAWPEAGAVVCDHDHEGLVIEPVLFEASQHPPEERVRVPDLQQMALVRLLDQPGITVPDP